MGEGLLLCVKEDTFY